MGKGDKKTRRGKLFSGSYGVLRARKRKPGMSVVTPTKKVGAKKPGPVVQDQKPEPEEAKSKAPVKEVKEAKQVKPVKKTIAKKEAKPKEEE